MANTEAELKTMYRSLDHMADRWTLQIGKSDKTSVIGLWKSMQKMRTFLQNERHDMEKELADKSRKWNSAYAHSQRIEAEKAYQQSAESICKGLEKDVNDFVIEKTQKIDEMLVTPPSPDQLNLLSALSLRGRNISRVELVRIVPSMLANYHALRILQNIGASAGCVIHLPQGADAVEMLSSLEEIESYFLRALKEVPKGGKPDATFRQFFYSDPKNPDTPIDPNVLKYSLLLDYVPQLKDYSVNQLTEAEKARLHVLFKSADKLDENNEFDRAKIADITKQILLDNPNDLELIMKSEYARYAEDMIRIKGVNAVMTEDAIEDAVNEQKEAVSNG